MGKCDMIFAREKDLEFHILSGSDHDLPSAGSKCSWRTCRTTIPRNSKLEVRHLNFNLCLPKIIDSNETYLCFYRNPVKWADLVCFLNSLELLLIFHIRSDST